MKTSTKILITVVSVAVVAATAVLLWLFVFKTNYKNAWWDGTSKEKLIFCGAADHVNCDNGRTDTATIDILNKNGDTYRFRISFSFGGSIEAEGECWQDKNDIYPDIERFCNVTTVGEKPDIMRNFVGEWRNVYLIAK